MIKRLFGKLAVILLMALFFTSCSKNLQHPYQTVYPSESTSPGVSETPVASSTPTATPVPTPEVSAAPEPTPEPVKESVKVKAVYVTGSSAGGSKLDKLIELANKTEVNSFVIDIKEGGYVNYESNVPLVKELGLVNRLYKADEVLKKCHDNNIHVVGRIVVFRDKGLASKKTELAIKKPNGSLWKEGKEGAWTNPYLEDVLNYNIEIAKEAVELGFDEIQFDYVRFPTAKASEVDYGENMPEKSIAISGFLKRAKEEISKVKEVPVSADIFGIVAESDRDGKAIGQQFEMLGKDIDYISPMIYPSHYANDSNGVMGNGVGQRINGVLFTKPDLEPYNVLYQSLLKVKDRISKSTDFKANVRPYLQDFTAKYLPTDYFQVYGSEQIRDQIKAVYDAGYEEWILWNSGNNYSEGALLPEN